MLIKLRDFGHSFQAPQPIEKDGLEILHAEMLGELVRVSDPTAAEACEKLVGELSLGIFPVGVIVDVEGVNARLNGLWVQRAIFDTVSNGKSASA